MNKIIIREINPKKFIIHRLTIPGVCDALECQLQMDDFGEGRWTLDILHGSGQREMDFYSVEIEPVEDMDFPNWTHVFAELLNYKPV